MWYFIGGFVLGFIVGSWSLAIALVKKHRQQQQATDETTVG